MFNFATIFCFIFYIHVFTTWVSAQAVFPEDDNSCYTSRREAGTCVNIKNCPFMVELLRTRTRDKETIDYLQKSTCGFSGRDPLICCPQNNQPNNNKNNAINNGDNNNSPLPSRPSCGLSNVTNSRIVGGAPAKLDEFPFMVLLGYRNQKNPSLPKWLCGGTLITYKHVLTAAHCANNRNDLYLVRAGELALFEDNDGASPEDIKITNIKMHEDFNTVQFTNDIAILTLERQPRNPMIWPVCLPLQDPLLRRDYVGEVGIVTGWGSVYFDGPRSSVLQVADIPILNQQNCQRSFGKSTVIDDRIICAGWLAGTKDTCQGDSGGPLMYAIKDGKVSWYYQIGVISYGFRCAEPGYPGVFTRVTNYLDWIRKNVA